MFFRKKEPKTPSKLRRRIGRTTDVIVIAAILFLAIYFGIQYFSRDATRDSDQGSSFDFNFGDMLRYFHIGWFEVVLILVLSGFFIYTKYKKNNQEEEE
jgi:TRAP-type C4-dicarboxylate transport system permease small subunit